MPGEVYQSASTGSPVNMAFLDHQRDIVRGRPRPRWAAVRVDRLTWLRRQSRPPRTRSRDTRLSVGAFSRFELRDIQLAGTLDVLDQSHQIGVPAGRHIRLVLD